MPPDREIVATRLLDAPRDLVFRLWTEPKHIERWWGPNGFTVTTSEMTVLPGGVWRFVLHGPDGTNFHNKIVYDKIVPPERLAYTHTGGSKFRAEIAFIPAGTKTEITVRLVFGSAAEREDAVEKYNAIAGLNQTLGRLAQYIEVQTRR